MRVRHDEDLELFACKSRTIELNVPALLPSTAVKIVIRNFIVCVFHVPIRSTGAYRKRKMTLLLILRLKKLHIDLKLGGIDC